jgi:Holliday junction resolvase RusA-like endonuclease
MNQTISLTIPIEPKAQMRARATAFRDKAGNVRARTYKDPEQERAENMLIGRLLYECNRIGLFAPIEGPVVLGVRVIRSIPVSWSKRKKNQALSGFLRPTSKPDLDNYLKHFKDCANGILWHDDAQVVGYLPGTGKYYGEHGRWEIEVRQAV